MVAYQESILVLQQQIARLAKGCLIVPEPENEEQPEAPHREAWVVVSRLKNSFNDLAYMIQKRGGKLFYLDDRGIATHKTLLGMGIKACFHCGHLNPIERQSCKYCEQELMVFTRGDGYYECKWWMMIDLFSQTPDNEDEQNASEELQAPSPSEKERVGHFTGRKIAIKGVDGLATVGNVVAETADRYPIYAIMHDGKQVDRMATYLLSEHLRKT